MKRIKEFFHELIKEFNEADINIKTLDDTNDIINIFYSFKQPIKADDVQLIKDMATRMMMDIKSCAIMFCRSVTNVERTHCLQRYGMTSADCEDIKNSKNPCAKAFEKLEIYKGAYNKINQI